MQSHWERLDTIRVVDAGYLLAGMEPERKWQFAPTNSWHQVMGPRKRPLIATLSGSQFESPGFTGGWLLKS